jgi:hypothetical protein
MRSVELFIIKVAKRCFDNLAELKYFEMTVTKSKFDSIEN